MLFLEQAQIAAGFLPANMAAQANPGDWVSLENFNHAAVVFFKDDGAGTEDPVLTISQATTAAGGGSKALNFTRYWRKTGGDIYSIGGWTKVTQSAANTLTAEGGEESITVVEFDASELDVSGGYSFLQASVADVGASAQIGCVLYLLTEARHPDKPENMPSVLV